MGSIKIAPSVLSADMANLKGELDKIARADYVHFDVMDGHFTGNLTFGVDILKAVKRSTDVPVDAHLMVSNPDETVDWYADAGADMITVHYEASTHLHRTLTHLQQRGVKAGALVKEVCTACGGSGGSKDRLEKIKEKGVLEFCTEPYFAPMEFIDPSQSGDAQYVGLDIEIAKYIADQLGVQLKITALDFTAVLAGVTDGKYDMAISAIAYSPARAEAMRMSNVYRADSTGYGFLVRSSDGEKYNSLESLKDAVVITQSGSVQESLYNQYVNGACKEFKLVANMTDGYLAVAEGKADVCICSTASADLYASANGGLVTTGFRFEVDPNMNGTCVAMPMDGTESLAEFVNQCIEELNKEGKIDAWYEEYSARAAELGIQ